MDNVYAWRLGMAAAKAKPGGDPIDHGWSLLKLLDDYGFDVVPRPAHVVYHIYDVGKSLNEMACLPRNGR